MRKNKAVIYLRVSTKRQIEQSQLKPCKEFCEERGYDVIDVLRDHAKSAYKNVKRKGFDKVKELTRSRQIQHVVVWSLDRLTRRGPSELKGIVTYLTTYEVQLHSVREQWIESINLPGSMGDVIRDFFFGLIGWMAEQESIRKSERILDSEKFQKAKDKGTVGRIAITEKTKGEVLKKLKEGKSYRQIHNEVTYKIKFGKVKHISIGKVSEIAKSVQKT